MASCGGYDFLHIELIPTHIPTSPSSSLAKVYFGNTPHCSQWNASTMDKTIRQGVRMPKATQLFCFGKPAALLKCALSLVSALRQANFGYSHDNEINSLQSRDYEEDGERLASLTASCIPSCISLFLADSLINIYKSRCSTEQWEKKGNLQLKRVGLMEYYREVTYAGLNPSNWIKK